MTSHAPAFLLAFVTGLYAAPAHQFEVVSIKASKRDAVAQDVRITFPPGRMLALNVTVADLLLAMTGFTGKVEGGPKWLESDRYDIVAKADGEFPMAERNAMLMALLEDRFQLAVHHEARDTPALALTTRKEKPILQSSNTGVKAETQPGERWQVIFKGYTMRGLAMYLQNGWGTPVVDRTGIVGSFDFTLDPNECVGPGTPFRDCLRPAAEAIGFRFDPVKIKRDITIIERVERPSEN